MNLQVEGIPLNGNISRMKGNGEIRNRQKRRTDILRRKEKRENLIDEIWSYVEEFGI